MSFIKSLLQKVEMQNNDVVEVLIYQRHKGNAKVTFTSYTIYKFSSSIFNSGHQKSN